MLRLRRPIPAAVHGVAVHVGRVHELARHALPLPRQWGGEGGQGSGLQPLCQTSGAAVGAHGCGESALRT